MTVKKKAVKTVPATGAKKSVDVPSLFRINVEVGNLDQAADFYGKLFGLESRRQAGSRCYFTCGPVTLQVVDVSSVGTPHPAAQGFVFHRQQPRCSLCTRQGPRLPLSGECARRRRRRH